VPTGANRRIHVSPSWRYLQSFHHLIREDWHVLDIALHQVSLPYSLSTLYPQVRKLLCPGIRVSVAPLLTLSPQLRIPDLAVVM